MRATLQYHKEENKVNFWVFGILLLIPMLSKLVHFLLTPSDVETTIQKTRKVLRNLGNFTVQIALLLIALVFVLANYFQIHHWLVSKLSYEVVSSIGEFLEKTFSTSSVLAIFRTLVSVVFNLVIFNVVPFFATSHHHGYGIHVRYGRGNHPHFRRGQLQPLLRLVRRRDPPERSLV